MKILLYILSCIIIPQSFSQDSFSFYMVNHQNRGCPSNSQCSKELGETRRIWLSLLRSKSSKLRRFIKDEGAPVPLWIKSSGEKRKDLIIWDSPCKNHRKKNKILLGFKFIKNFNSLVGDKDLLVPITYKWDGSTLSKYYAMRGDAPVGVNNQGLHYIKDDEGSYYTLVISQTGKVSLSGTQSSFKTPKEISCHPRLTKAFNKVSLSKNLYLGHFCKSIWNSSKNKYEEFIFGWSCN